MKRFSLVIATLGVLFSCTPKEDQPQNNNLAPSVTVGAEKVSAVSAILCGEANLESSMSSDMTMGIMLSTNSGVLPSNSTKIEATDISAKQGSSKSYNYKVNALSLSPATTYFYRSYITQNGQDTYGETKEFKTKEIASLLCTQEASEVSAASAKLNASLDLTDVQYSSIEAGFLWSTSEDSQSTSIKASELENGSFYTMLGSLSHKTQYWYKAFVKLDSQSLYGEVKTFITGSIPVESVSLDKTEYSINTIGDSFSLIATVLPNYATDKSITWSSDKESVATVDQDGNVLAVGNGTATIIVTTNDQGKTANCIVTVAQRVTGISIPSTLSIEEGQEQTLTVSITPDNANDKTVIWSSSAQSVASVDENGKVVAKSRGKTTIKAETKDGSGLFATCNVIVSYPCPEGAVDMGVTTKEGYKLYWAKCNLGETGFVSSPEDFGGYYAWGEVQTKGDYYNWDNYKWCKGTYDTLTKYNNNAMYGTVDNKTVLDSSDDAAHIKLGGRWRMPTEGEWTALRDNCTKTWTTQNSVPGMLFSSTNGNSIFIPAADNKGVPVFVVEGPKGTYWSSTVGSTSYYGSGLYFNDQGGAGIGGWERYAGLPIRPVSEQNL